MKKLKTILVLVTAMSQSACSVFGVRSEEQPKYKVVLKEGNKEIREYSPYIVATTTVDGSFDDAQGDAFRILAGYIFGKNKSKTKIAMTSPVTRSEETKNEKIAMTAPVIMESNEKIAMTAPVIVEPKEDKQWTMTFSMPSKYKMEDLPEPLDPRVKLKQVEGHFMASYEYSGFWSDSKRKKKAETLAKWIASNNQYEMDSAPMFAGYDPPWTLWFLRRNEALIQLKKVND
ncbi:MAG: heme-binding protein [Bdellovibrionales bacterium]